MTTTTTTETKLHTPEEAVERIPVHPRTLVRYAKEEKIGHVKVGPKYFFTDEHIEAYIAANTVVPRKPEPTPKRNPRYTK